MLPLTLLAAQKLSGLLTTGDSLSQTISSLATEAGVTLPLLVSNQVILASAPPALADNEIPLTYPRVLLYSTQVKNSQLEKFRTFSGSIAVVAEIWASGNLVGDSDQWIHYYVEALTQLMRDNIGDWGDGFFFAGVYEVQLQPPKVGGFGYLQLAKMTCSLNVSLN